MGSASWAAERAVWVVRCQYEDETPRYLTTACGDYASAHWAGWGAAAHEFTDRHDAYTARDEARDGERRYADAVGESADTAALRVVRRYRPLDGGST